MTFDEILEHPAAALVKSVFKSVFDAPFLVPGMQSIPLDSTPSETSIFVGVVAFLAVGAIAYRISATKETNRKLIDPDGESYRWGYFLGIYSLVWPAPLAAFFLTALIVSGFNLAFLVAALWPVAVMYCGLQLPRGSKMAWVVLTLISFNIALWLVNGVYLSKRWGRLRTL